MKTVVHRFVLLTLLLTSMPSLAAEVGGFRVEQSSVTLPNMKVYAEILDSNGAAVDLTSDNGTGAVQISGSLGSFQTTTAAILPFAQSGEGIGYVFLVDISKSLKPQQFEQMREAISTLTGNMQRKDMAAIITFGKEVKVLCDYTADKNELKTKINSLKLVDDLTQLHRGLLRAVEMGRRKDASLPQRKVIITLSDGEDDFAGGLTKDEVIDALKIDRVPIYAIGYYPPPSTPKKDEHLKSLGEFARRSGGELIRANNVPYNEIYTILNGRIRSSFIINLTCDNCTGEGQVSRLQLTLTAGTKQLTDGTDVRILPRPNAKPTPSAAPPPTPPPPPAPQVSPQQMYLAAAATILAALMIILAMRRRNHIKRQNNAQNNAMLDKTSFRSAHHIKPEPMPQQPQPSVKLSFAVVGREPTSYEATVDKPIVLGRNKAYCAVTIADDDEISGIHCEISKAGGKLYIKDLGSTNGTLVNGVSLTSVQKLDDGDIITLGQTQLRVSILQQGN